MKRSVGRILVVLACSLFSSLPLAAQDDSPSGGPPTASEEPAGPTPIVLLFTDLSAGPWDVPGIPGAHFSSFDRPFGSPNGNWILSADTDLATTEDELILVNGAVGAREGTPATWTAGENVGTIDTKLGINNAGQWVFATNTDGPTTADDYIVLVSGGVFSAAAQEGQPIPALPPATYDDLLDSSVITSAGVVGLSADGIDGGPPTTQDEILVLGATLLAQEGVTMPAGQLGAEFWENFDLDDFWVSADGAHWLAQGDLTGSTTTDDVVAFDGAVVVQEGVVLPGSGFVNPVDDNGIVGVWMAPNGDWFVRGNNDVTEQDWIYRNGAVLATLGDPIYTGATEVWSDAEFSDCFFFHVANATGHYVIGGVSDGPTAANGVLVLDGTTVVAREGDPVDVNGNGMPDDDAFINTFGNDDGVLTDAGLFYFVATIKDGMGTVIGDGFFVTDLSALIGGGCTLTCPGNVAVGNDLDQCGAVVNYAAPTPSGQCGPVVCAPPSGSFFPVGPTMVTCDELPLPGAGAPSGTLASCSFSVTVADVQPPALSCPADLFVAVPPGTLSWPVDYVEPTPMDNCPGATAGCAPPSGSSFPLGTSTVSCSAVDGAGNSATCAFDVTLAAQAVQDIPAASSLGLAALALLLAGAAFVMFRRSG